MICIVEKRLFQLRACITFYLHADQNSNTIPDERTANHSNRTVDEVHNIPG